MSNPRPIKIPDRIKEIPRTTGRCLGRFLSLDVSIETDLVQLALDLSSIQLMVDFHLPRANETVTVWTFCIFWKCCSIVLAQLLQSIPETVNVWTSWSDLSGRGGSDDRALSDRRYAPLRLSCAVDRFLFRPAHPSFLPTWRIAFNPLGSHAHRADAVILFPVRLTNRTVFIWRDRFLDNTAIRVTYIRGRERLDSDGSLECTPSHRHQSFITQSWTYKTRVFLVMAMVVTFAWSGHASSIKGAEGMLVHSIHALAVFIWTGGLLILGFWSPSDRNWGIFLEWFKPLVTLCFLLIVGSGIYLMSVVVQVEEYSDSWILPYGQALLWKHVWFYPCWSSVSWTGSGVTRLLNDRLKSDGCGCAWKASWSASLHSDCVARSTGTPHSIKDTLQSSGAGPLSGFLFPSLRFTYSDIRFEPTMISLFLMAISLLFVGLLVYVIRSTQDSIKTLYLGLGVSISLFFAALYSISVYLWSSTWAFQRVRRLIQKERHAIQQSFFFHTYSSFSY